MEKRYRARGAQRSVNSNIGGENGLQVRFPAQGGEISRRRRAADWESENGFAAGSKHYEPHFLKS